MLLCWILKSCILSNSIVRSRNFHCEAIPVLEKIHGIYNRTCHQPWCAGTTCSWNVTLGSTVRNARYLFVSIPPVLLFEHFLFVFDSLYSWLCNIVLLFDLTLLGFLPKILTTKRQMTVTVVAAADDNLDIRNFTPSDLLLSRTVSFDLKTYLVNWKCG